MSDPCCSSPCWHPALVGVGASGAIFGLIGLELGWVLRQSDSMPANLRDKLVNAVLQFLGYNLFFGLLSPHIDLAAHIGGLAAGICCGLVLSHPLCPEAIPERVQG